MSCYFEFFIFCFLASQCISGNCTFPPRFHDVVFISSSAGLQGRAEIFCLLQSPFFVLVLTGTFQALHRLLMNIAALPFKRTFHLLFLRNPSFCAEQIDLNGEGKLQYFQWGRNTTIFSPLWVHYKVFCWFYQ